MAGGLFNKVCVTICILAVFSFAGLVSAADNTGWEDLNRTSATALGLVKQQHYQEASESLEKYSDEFIRFYSGGDLTMNDIKLITAVFDEALTGVKSMSTPHEERVRKVYKLRLLTDAFAESSKPLWISTEDTLIASLNSMEETVIKGAQPSAGQLNTFNSYFNTIAPAIEVSVESETFQRLNSQVKFIKILEDNSASQADWQKHLSLLKGTFSVVYAGEEYEDYSEPSFYWFIITVTSAIISGLTYTGWKKFRAHRSESNKAGSKKEYVREKMRNR